MTDELGWVIERSVNGDVSYWCGGSPEDFRPENDSAVRFAREVDATAVLGGLGLDGRVTEHMWCG